MAANQRSAFSLFCTLAMYISNGFGPRMPAFHFILKTFVRIIHITDFLPSREALIAIQLPDGQIMPAGTTYCIDLASLQLNKRVWGEDVLKFNPDRFQTTKTHTYQATV